MKDFFAKNRIPIVIIIAMLAITVLVRLSNKPTPTMAWDEIEKTLSPTIGWNEIEKTLSPTIELDETEETPPSTMTWYEREKTPPPQQPPAPQQPPVKRISYIEAPKHMGEYACVVGKVDHVNTIRGDDTYLNFCSSHITSPFSAVIFQPNAFKFPLPKRFEGKLVEITGPITDHRGQARIILNDPSQIKISKRQETAELELPPPKCINYTEGLDYVGEYVCVTGKIDRVRTTEDNIYLNFGPNYRTRSFGAVIFKPNKFKFPLPKRYEGKTVEITGLIATYGGQAYIILNNPSQIKHTGRSSR